MKRVRTACLTKKCISPLLGFIHNNHLTENRIFRSKSMTILPQTSSGLAFQNGYFINNALTTEIGHFLFGNGSHAFTP
ncbi:hypothetical protein [Rubritalea tangerina]|uniref:hypothetical protein n=1 Tax=Rubritalea tangerina TaxID=430798 RepID=UPI00361288A6